VLAVPAPERTERLRRNGRLDKPPAGKSSAPHPGPSAAPHGVQQAPGCRLRFHPQDG
jgi:hypothetical protein